jgi:hypothetical protein
MGHLVPVYTAKAVYANEDVTCAILENDNTKCWGKNTVGYFFDRAGYFFVTRLTAICSLGDANSANKE